MRQDLVPAINQADGSSVNSAAIPAQNLFAASIQGVATGSIAGTFKLQASNDIVNQQNPQNPAPTNWTDITGATVTLGAGAIGLIPKTDICYQWVRIVWTKTGGTGTFIAIFKALGA